MLTSNARGGWRFCFIGHVEELRGHERTWRVGAARVVQQLSYERQEGLSVRETVRVRGCTEGSHAVHAPAAAPGQMQVVQIGGGI